jgi:hypothetical protein
MDRYVYAFDSDPREADEPAGQLALRCGQREHGPAVIGIGVQVEEARGSRALLNRLEGRAIASFADVGNGQEERRLRHPGEG